MPDKKKAAEAAYVPVFYSAFINRSSYLASPNRLVVKFIRFEITRVKLMLVILKKKTYYQVCKGTLIYLLKWPQPFPCRIAKDKKMWIQINFLAVISQPGTIGFNDLSASGLDHCLCRSRVPLAGRT